MATKSSTATAVKAAPAKKASKSAPVAEPVKAKSFNPELTTTTKKDLSDMSEAHRNHILRWEEMLGSIGAEHVWAATPRFKGRGEGPFYLAIKKGKRSYAIVSFDTSKPTAKSTMLIDGISSPKAVLDQFGEYRTLAKSERGPVATVEAAPAADTKATTKVPTRKVLKKVSAKKAS